MTPDRVRPVLVDPLGPVYVPRRLVVAQDARWRSTLRVVQWIAALMGLIVVAALCAGCGQGPEARTSSPHPACAWPAERCCSMPPTLGRHSLRDLRAERIARAAP